MAKESFGDVFSHEHLRLGGNGRFKWYTTERADGRDLRQERMASNLANISSFSSSSAATSSHRII